MLRYINSKNSRSPTPPLHFGDGTIFNYRNRRWNNKQALPQHEMGDNPGDLHRQKLPLNQHLLSLFPRNPVTWPCSRGDCTRSVHLTIEVGEGQVVWPQGEQNFTKFQLSGFLLVNKWNLGRKSKNLSLKHCCLPVKTTTQTKPANQMRLRPNEDFICHRKIAITSLSF